MFKNEREIIKNTKKELKIKKELMIIIIKE